MHIIPELLSQNYQDPPPACAMNLKKNDTRKKITMTKQTISVIIGIWMFIIITEESQQY